MTPGTLTVLGWSATALIGLAFTGLGYTVVRAFGSGAGAYADSMSEEASRRFEDLFLFIPAKRISDIGRAAAAAVFLLCFVPLFDRSRHQSLIPFVCLATPPPIWLAPFPRQAMRLRSDKTSSLPSPQIRMMFASADYPIAHTISSIAAACSSMLLTILNWVRQRSRLWPGRCVRK